MSALRSLSLTLLSSLVLLVLGAAPTHAVTVTVSSVPAFTSFGTARAIDGGSLVDSQTLNPTTVPFNATSNAAVPVATNETRYLLSNAALEIQFDHTFGIPPGSGGESLGAISFTVDVDVPFVLEGVYSATATQRYFMVQEAKLVNNTTSAVPFEGRQETIGALNVVDQSFTLGGLAGDGPNQYALGSLTGTLIAGQTYTLSWRWSIQQLPDVLANETPGSATGALRLLLVPEPSVLAWLAIGLCGFLARDRSGTPAQ